MIRRETSDQTAARFLAMRRPRRERAASRRTLRPPLLIEWEGDARNKFGIGDRVVLSEHGRKRGISSNASVGVVVGFSSRWAHVVRIKRDGMVTIKGYAASFWDPEPVPAKPPIRLRPKPEALAARGIVDRTPVARVLRDIFSITEPVTIGALGPADPEALR